MAEAVTTLSHRANSDHTADVSRGPKRLVLVKMDRSGRRLRFAARTTPYVSEAA